MTAYEYARVYYSEAGIVFHTAQGVQPIADSKDSTTLLTVFDRLGADGWLIQQDASGWFLRREK